MNETPQTRIRRTRIARQLRLHLDQVFVRRFRDGQTIPFPAIAEHRPFDFHGRHAGRDFLVIHADTQRRAVVAFDIPVHLADLATEAFRADAGDCWLEVFAVADVGDVVDVELWKRASFFVPEREARLTFADAQQAGDVAGTDVGGAEGVPMFG